MLEHSASPFPSLHLTVYFVLFLRGTVEALRRAFFFAGEETDSAGEAFLGVVLRGARFPGFGAGSCWGVSGAKEMADDSASLRMTSEL